MASLADITGGIFIFQLWLLDFVNRDVARSSLPKKTGIVKYLDMVRCFALSCRMDQKYDMDREIAEARERRRIALALRNKNMTFSEIGLVLNCSKQRAEQIVKKARKEREAA